MEEDLCGYMDWITQAEDMDELDEDGNPRETVFPHICSFISPVWRLVPAICCDYII